MNNVRATVGANVGAKNVSPLPVPPPMPSPPTAVGGTMAWGMAWMTVWPTVGATVGAKNFSPQHRRSIRLKGYDYSQEGLYFITICCHNRQNLFGEIVGGEMQLNDAGHIARQCWHEIPNHFPHAALDEFVIMPNHVHGIICIVGAVGAKNFSPLPPTDDVRAKNVSPPRGTSKTIGSIVRGFKIGVTKWMRQNTPIHDVWQRNYYEHIIRNDAALERIRNYIVNNPAQWEQDSLRPATK